MASMWRFGLTRLWRARAVSAAALAALAVVVGTIGAHAAVPMPDGGTAAISTTAQGPGGTTLLDGTLSIATTPLTNGWEVITSSNEAMCAADDPSGNAAVPAWTLVYPDGTTISLGSGDDLNIATALSDLSISTTSIPSGSQIEATAYAMHDNSCSHPEAQLLATIPIGLAANTPVVTISNATTTDAQLVDGDTMHVAITSPGGGPYTTTVTATEPSGAETTLASTDIDTPFDVEIGSFPAGTVITVTATAPNTTQYTGGTGSASTTLGAVTPPPADVPPVNQPLASVAITGGNSNGTVNPGTTLTANPLAAPNPPGTDPEPFTPPVTFQWYENGEAIPGATASQFTVPPDVYDGTIYTVTATSEDGITASSTTVVSSGEEVVEGMAVPALAPAPTSNVAVVAGEPPAAVAEVPAGTTLTAVNTLVTRITAANQGGVEVTASLYQAGAVQTTWTLTYPDGQVFHFTGATFTPPVSTPNGSVAVATTTATLNGVTSTFVSPPVVIYTPAPPAAPEPEPAPPAVVVPQAATLTDTGANHLLPLAAALAATAGAALLRPRRRATAA